jgi:hypothetical protein
MNTEEDIIFHCCSLFQKISWWSLYINQVICTLPEISKMKIRNWN